MSRAEFSALLFLLIVIMEGVIYCYTSPSGKRYIGQTCDEKNRKKRFENLNLSYSNGGKIDNARCKYGPQKFSYEILEKYCIEDKNELINILNKQEEYYIEKYDTYKNGYNSTKGGKAIITDNRSTGQKKAKRDWIAIGKKISETKKKNPRVYSEEERMNISLRSKKSVTQYDLNGNLVHKWDSLKEAAKSVNLNDSSSIVACCKRKIKSAAGFVWRYTGDDFGVLSAHNIAIANGRASIGGKVCKPVLQIDNNNCVIKEWSSISEAEEYYGTKSTGRISRCCRKMAEKAYGYKWKYKYDNRTN